MSHPVLLRRLEWDSEFFGIRIAKTLSTRLQPREVNTVLGQCEQAEIKCLYCELEPEELDTVAYVQACGFTFVEFRMVLRHDLHQSLPERSEYTGSLAVLDDCPREEDMADLVAIADAISPMSRFAVDRRFGRDASRRLYARWLQNCLEDATVKMIVARVDGRAAGFVTLKPEGEAMWLTLLGVAPSAQGGGIGAQLTQAAVRASAACGAAKLLVVTQGRNARAVRTYERCGFTLGAGTYYFHKWWE
jgi:ribosomal protein S18 acetylase RimI-like enzyme